MIFALHEPVVMFTEPGVGVVEQIIMPAQPGRVEFGATYWPARLFDSQLDITLAPACSVMVVGREGITLLIVPVA